MSLADEYQRQLAWRSWPTILDELPLHPGQKILDLGCAAGDLAAELVARGAFVIGVDLNEELLQAARAKGLSNAEFLLGELRALARRSRRAATIFTWGASCKAILGSRDSRSRSS